MKRLLMGRTLVIVFVCLVIVGLGSAITFAVPLLNQSVGYSITITQPSGGSSGGGPVPTPTPSVYIYKDSAFTQVLNQITCTYDQGSNHQFTAYMKTTDISLLGVSPTITVSGAPAGVTISAVIGTDIAGVTPVTITISGGTASGTALTGTSTFTAG